MFHLGTDGPTLVNKGVGPRLVECKADDSRACYCALVSSQERGY